MLKFLEKNSTLIGILGIGLKFIIAYFVAKYILTFCSDEGCMDWYYLYGLIMTFTILLPIVAFDILVILYKQIQKPFLIFGMIGLNIFIGLALIYFLLY